MYVLIEFKEINDAGANSVAIVRKSWLSPRKQDVFWPPIKNQKVFDRTLQSETNEDIEKWKLYPVSRCLYETDDLEKAKHKLKLSEVTSDLTDNESANRSNHKKRKVVTPRRYISSDDDDEESDINRPPQLNKKLKNILKESQFQETTAEISRGINTQNHQREHETSSPEIVHVTETAPGIFRGEQNIHSFPKQSETSFQTSVQAICHVTDPPVAVQNNAHGINLQNYLKVQRADIAGNSLPEPTGFHETVVNLLSHIKIQNAQILALLQNKEQAKLKDFPFTFPMKSVDDIQDLEKLLEDQKQVDVLISYLSTIGGRDLSCKVSRILKHLFLDTLAAKYSFYGKRSNKRPFSELHLKTAVLNSVKTSCPKSTEKDIEDCIKIWLKHAPDREKNKIKRATLVGDN